MFSSSDAVSDKKKGSSPCAARRRSTRRCQSNGKHGAALSSKSPVVLGCSGTACLAGFFSKQNCKPH